MSGIAGISILMAAAIIFSPVAQSATWHQFMASKLSTEFDTNPSVSPTYTEGVWRTLFEPQYEVIGNFGGDELRTGLALQLSRSSNEAISPSRDRPNAFLNWLRQSAIGEFRIATRYSETSIRDAGIDATNQLPVSSGRVTKTLSAKWTKAMSDRSTFTVDGSYENFLYTGVGNTYVDYASRAGSFIYTYILNDQNSPFIKIAYADYLPTGGGTNSRLDSTAIGLNWNTSKNLEASVQAGNANVNNAEFGTHWGMSMKYTLQRSVALFNVNRQVLASGLNGFVTIDQANYSWIYELNEGDKTGIDFGWIKNHYTTETINRSTGVWVQHDIDFLWGLRMYYMHNAFSRGGIGEAASNILGLSLSYTRTDF